jgi:CheY-like chemotaxis protein
VVLVDDDKDILKVLKDGLEANNYEVHAFDNAVEALNFIKSTHSPSLLISDIRMPGMNGFEFVRKIREINTAVKVLLMSAFEINSTELSAGLGKAKIDGLIQKPVSLHELNAIVQKQLEMKKPS